ncbi:hypothetical protein BJ170DRAFT_689493 [Xylariales sp. AK1849]|nr:hypothetical protein BJ170DRAFT_689493 [Xylariales sp. AK1849]
MDCFSLEGFTFLAEDEFIKTTENAKSSLLKTDHFEFVDRNPEQYDKETRVLVNLCILFKAVVHYKAFSCLPEFWELVCAKWGLTDAYWMMRRLVLMYARARQAFLTNGEDTASQHQTELSDLSALLAGLVDEWLQGCRLSACFDPREEIIRERDDDLRLELNNAQDTWVEGLESFINQSFGILHRAQQNFHGQPEHQVTFADTLSNDTQPRSPFIYLFAAAGSLRENHMEDPKDLNIGDTDVLMSPYEQTSPFDDTVVDNHRKVPEANMYGPDFHLAMDMGMEIGGLPTSACALSEPPGNSTFSACRSERSSSHQVDETIEYAPVQPLDAEVYPRFKEADGHHTHSLSDDQHRSSPSWPSSEEIVDSVSTATQSTPDHGTSKDCSSDDIQRSPEVVNFGSFQLPIRTIPKQSLFPIVLSVSGQHVAKGETSEGTNADAEDWNMMYGKRLLGPLSLADMIRDYMRREREAEKTAFAA